MDEQLEFKGEWWLPSRPEERVLGTLKFVPGEGGMLELMGLLNDAEPGVILGMSADGKPVTLQDCIETRARFRRPGLDTSMFYASAVLEGAHFSTPEEIIFSRVSVLFSNVEEWMYPAGPDVRVNRRGNKMVVECEEPEAIRVSVEQGMKISLVPHVGYTVIDGQAAANTETWFTVEPSQAKSLDEYLGVVGDIRNFLCLATTERVRVLAMEGRLAASGGGVRPATIDGKAVKVFLPFVNGRGATRPSLGRDIIFRLADVAEQIGQLLTRWLESATRLRCVHDLYFAAHDQPDMYVEHGFFCFVEALEAYHRRAIRRTDFDNEELRRRREEILDARPDWEHKDWLSARLEYGNEPSLRKRLKEIVERFRPLCSQWFGRGCEKRRFLDQVVETRNYLVHHDERLEAQAARGELLERLALRLKWLVAACLLEQVGFEPEIIANLFSRNMRYLHETGV